MSETIMNEIEETTKPVWLETIEQTKYDDYFELDSLEMVVEDLKKHEHLEKRLLEDDRWLYQWFTNLVHAAARDLHSRLGDGVCGIRTWLGSGYDGWVLSCVLLEIVDPRALTSVLTRSMLRAMDGDGFHEALADHPLDDQTQADRRNWRPNSTGRPRPIAWGPWFFQRAREDSNLRPPV